MSPSRSSTTRELLRLYSLAARGEYNLRQFLDERPDIIAQLGIDLDRSYDDAELALQIAPAVGRHKRWAARVKAGEHAERSAAAVRQLIATSRRAWDRVEVDADLLLGDLLADRSQYISFDLGEARVPILRATLVSARAPLRNFIDVAAYLDERGLHIRWRGGRGGFNFRPRVEERGAAVLDVDLRPAPPRRRQLAGPVLLADVLADLGFI